MSESPTYWTDPLGLEYWDCPECGGPNYTEVDECIHCWEYELPNSDDDLQDLLDQWRAKEEWHREQSIKKAEDTHTGMARAFRECIEDLEGVVD